MTKTQAVMAVSLLNLVNKHTLLSLQYFSVPEMKLKGN